MKKTNVWETNIWTGTDLMQVTENSQIKRMFRPPLYMPIYWGDFSLRYTIAGQWTRSLKDAKRQLELLAKTEKP